MTNITQQPDHGDLAQAKADVSTLTNGVIVEVDPNVESPDQRAWEAAAERLERITSSRPFDREIRLEEVKGAVSAILVYGQACRWDDRERWEARLTALTEDPRFAGDRGIRLAEAEGAADAIGVCGMAHQWKDLERWGARLTTLAEDPRFADDREIRLREAGGAVNAIGVYGDACRWNDLERWGARLTALTEDPRFAGDPKIRLAEAKGAVSAILKYGGAGHWEDLERWWARLAALAEDPRFADDREIRLREAQGASSAILKYGDAGHWKDLERWGERLTALAEDPRFAGDPDIRLAEVIGADRTLSVYNIYRKIDSDLDRRRTFWIARLSAAARSFPSNRIIQEKASDRGVSYAQQQEADWPYGAPDTPPAPKEHNKPASVLWSSALRVLRRLVAIVFGLVAVTNLTVLGVDDIPTLPVLLVSTVFGFASYGIWPRRRHPR